MYGSPLQSDVRQKCATIGLSSVGDAVVGLAMGFLHNPIGARIDVIPSIVISESLIVGFQLTCQVVSESVLGLCAYDVGEDCVGSTRDTCPCAAPCYYL